MHSCWPVTLAAGATADAFTLARFIGSWCCCRCLRAGSLHMNCSSFQWVRVGPLHWQLVLLPMPSSWPIQYAIAAAANAFVLARCICISAAADAFVLAHCICMVAAANLFELACNIESCCCCRCLSS